MEKQSIADYAKEQVLEVKCPNFMGVDEVPEGMIIFDKMQSGYVCALAANILLNDVKGQLLNIIEGIGMPDRQEKAIKRSVTNVLHETHRHISDSMDLVTK